MFWNKEDKIINSLRFKLTVWFSLIFTVIFLLIFTVVQLYVRNHLKELTDNTLFEKVKKHLFLGYPSTPAVMDLNEITNIFEYVSSKEGSNDVFYIYLDSAYHVITSSTLENWKNLQFDSTNIPYLPDKPDKEEIKNFLNLKSYKEKHTSIMDLDHEYRSHTILQTLQIKGRNDKIRVAFQHFNNHKLFITGISLRDKENFKYIVRRIFLISYLVLLLIVITMVNFLTRRSLAGVEKVKDTAISIRKNNFSYRVPSENEATEIRDLAHAFNDMLDRIERLMKEQKDMTHNIAHDLRSPITSIRGMAETTISSHASENDYKMMMGKIIDNCDRLVHLINSMLDISDIETGNFKTEMADIDIVPIIDECIEIYQPMADEKSIALKKIINVPSIVIPGNKYLLQRALGNIVGNAIKYSNENGIVEIQAEIQRQDLTISVRDNGIGIPLEEQKRIFERFYRIDKNRSVEGNGLGLSLAKAYIEFHRGTIGLESETGKGSTFTISLPLAWNGSSPENDQRK